MNLLNLYSINVNYNGIQVIWDVSLSVAEGEITVLLGANSSGKSTILNTISGLFKPSSGVISFQGEELNKMDAYKRVEKGISLIPEGRRVFPYLTVKENLQIGGFAHRSRKLIPQTLKLVYELFPRLRERHGQQAGTLSGGEQQMLAIGRGLMSRPKLLMLDEPSSGLAPAIIKNIFSHIKEINEQGVTILLVEQHIYGTIKLANKVYILENGRLAVQGTGADIVNNEQIRKAYFGK